MCATGQSPPKKPRSREEPVIATDTEVQWMQDPTDAKTLWMRERKAELVSSLQQGRRWKALHWRPAPEPHWTNFKMFVADLPSLEKFPPEIMGFQFATLLNVLSEPPFCTLRGRRWPIWHDV